MAPFYAFGVKDAQGNMFPFQQLQGKAVLIVNVASKCGYTPQYAGLEELYRQYEDQGFVILGFPCNQFGGQEPGSDAEIVQFCSTTYDVTFPIMAKVDVNGANAAPIFDFLKSSAPGVMGTEAIKWNFTKFLISREGQVLERFAPQTDPMDLTSAIERTLGLQQTAVVGNPAFSE